MPTATKTTTDTLVSLLSHLIRIPTLTSDHATNRAALDWVEQQLEELPLHISRFESGGYPSLIATTRDTKNPKLWLAAHLDVVPGDVKQFEPTIRDGRLYGRGAHDMKYAVAIFIALLQELGSDLPKYDLGLMLTTDEETGGEHGVRWLLDDNGYRGQVVLLPECGTPWELEYGAKGMMWWKLTSHGRTAHASRPWEGHNALDELVRFVELVRKNVKPEPCADPKHEHTTLNLGTLSGGKVGNQVPSSAEAIIDIRLAPDTSPELVTSWIDQAKSTFPNVTAELITGAGAYTVPHNGPTVVFRDIVKQVTGHDVTTTLSHGSSDARFFAAHNIPVINVPPTAGDQHGPNEWVDIEDLARYYEVSRRFVAEWARS